MMFPLAARTDMFEALRLTREGKLVEAMTVLRGGSSRAARDDEDGDTERHQSDGAVRASVIDLVPPGDPAGAGWPRDGLSRRASRRIAPYRHVPAAE